MITIPDLDQELLEDRIVLVDADCVSYYGGFGCDKLPFASAARRIDQRMKQIQQDTRAATQESFLSGSSNFRDAVATLKQYKENRYQNGKRIKPRPYWFQECRDYLAQEYNATVSVHQEADDAVSIRAKELQGKYSRVYISSIDKDLQINYCWHHNMTTGDTHEVTPPGILELDDKGKLRGTGELFFYAQMLMGDPADCIPGLPKVTPWMKETFGITRLGGCGPRAAFHVLLGVETAEEAEQRVWDCYQSYWNENVYRHWRTDVLLGKNPMEQFREQGRLLWMRQQEGELWEPKYIKEGELAD